MNELGEKQEISCGDTFATIKIEICEVGEVRESLSVIKALPNRSRDVRFVSGARPEFVIFRFIERFSDLSLVSRERPELVI